MTTQHETLVEQAARLAIPTDVPLSATEVALLQADADCDLDGEVVLMVRHDHHHGDRSAFEVQSGTPAPGGGWLPLPRRWYFITPAQVDEVNAKLGFTGSADDHDRQDATGRPRSTTGCHHFRGPIGRDTAGPVVPRVARARIAGTR